MLATVTFVHVILSLIGIGSGLVVLYGLLNAKRLDRWTAWFLWTTVATSVTAFMFPAILRDRDSVPDRSGDRHSRAIRLPSRRRMAQDLRDYGYDCALFQCFRSDRTTLSEGPGAERVGAHTIGTTVPDLPGDCDGPLCDPGYSSGIEISKRS
jgi:hypothetical protein